MKSKYTITPDLWRQMIRDFEGRWEKYVGIKSTISKSAYFWGKEDWDFYLKQKSRKDIIDLVESNIRSWKYLDNSLDKITNFTSYYEHLKWLKELHRLMMWKKGPDEVHYNYLTPSSNHTIIVFGDVIPIAKRFADPYPEESNGPVFNSIPEAGLPADIIISTSRIDHYYPHPKYFPYYLRESLKTLKKILHNESGLSDIAYFYQITLNMHLFEIINNSMMMNIVNYLLTKRGLQGIEQGILDFVAYRLMPENFTKYFEEEVNRIQ